MRFSIASAFPFRPGTTRCAYELYVVGVRWDARCGWLPVYGSHPLTILWLW